MDSALIGVIIGALVILAIVVIAALGWRRQQAMIAALSESDRLLHEQCKAADKKVADAKRRHDRAVKAAARTLAQAETLEKTAKIDSRNYVTRLDLRLNGNHHPLDERVVAALDSTGDITSYVTQRSTLTRIATGAVIAGPAGAVVGGLARKNTKHAVDNRKLYLMVTGADWQEVVTVNPDAGDKARAMMQSINVNAQNVVIATAAHVEAVARARAELDRVTADTQELDGATAARAALGTDPLKTARAERKGATAETHGDTMFLLGDPDREGDGPQDSVR